MPAGGCEALGLGGGGTNLGPVVRSGVGAILTADILDAAPSSASKSSSILCACLESVFPYDSGDEPL